MDDSGAEGRNEPAEDTGLSFGGLTAFAGPQAVVADDGHLAVGTRLDDVTIVRFIAEGGMGRVYEALQGMPCRTVAVKVLRPGVLSSVAAKRFHQETQILGRLTHAGIARIYSVGILPMVGYALPYFVMEYIEEAQPITEYAATRGLTARERVRLVREACQAVAHGHLKGVVHRDLKPGNILIDAAGQPKIIDFGVARSTDTDAALTTMHTDIGQLLGTLRYMCPEQFDGTSDDIDVRADVYALGVVLYELLAGRSPYDTAGKAVHQVARVVREVEPRALGSVDRTFRGDLDTIVSKCLEKDRTLRYSSAVELEADLGRYLQGQPIAAEAPGLIGSLARVARRHRLAAASAVAVATAVALGVAATGIFAVRAERSRIREVDARERADAARLEAIDNAEEASAERALAGREKERANAEAETAKRLLYVANMRALQAALTDGNRSGAQQLLGENKAFVPEGLPIELRCVAAELDDALVVLKTVGPVTEVGFAPDGTMMAVTAAKGPMADDSVVRSHLDRTVGHRVDRTAGGRQASFYSVEPGLRYAAMPKGKSAWAAAWSTVAESPAPGAPGGGRPNALALSPDGSRAAVHRKDGGIAVVDRPSGSPIATLADHAGRLAQVMFSPTGDRLVGCDINGSLGIWDASTGRLIGRGHGDDGTTKVASLTFSGDGSRCAAALVSSVGPDEMVVYDSLDGRIRSRFVIPGRRLNRAAVNVVALSHDGERLATACKQAEITIWNAADGTATGTLRGHSTPVETLAFSRDGSQIASSVASGKIRIWNAHTYDCDRELVGHGGRVPTLAFHPDGITLASGSVDRTVRIWATSSAPACAILPGVSDLAMAAFSPDGRLVAVATEGERAIGVWDAATAERVGSLEAAAGAVTQLSWSPAGDLLAGAFATPGREGEARVWRPDTAAPVAVLGGHVLGVVGVVFSPDGRCVLTTSGNGLVQAWDPQTGVRRWVSPAAARNPSAKLVAQFAQDGRVVAHGLPQLLDVDSGVVVSEIRDRGYVTCLTVSPDGSLLANGMALGTVYLEDVVGGSIQARLVGHTDSVQSIAFSPDGDVVATGSLDGTARLWSIRQAQELRCLLGHSGSIETVLFTPDGRRLVTGATDGTTRIWDVGLGRELYVLPGRADAPRAVAISPDGTTLLAPTAAGGARIWGLTNAAVIAARQASPLDGHGRSIAPGEVGRPDGRPRHRLREGGEERGEVAEILAVEAEGPQVR